MQLLVVILSIFLSLGIADSSGSEFALISEGKGAYVPAGFSAADKYFFPADDGAAAFPFFLPGPLCAECGAGYWSGPTLQRQNIVLKLSGLRPGSRCGVDFKFTEIDWREGMVMRLTVNGVDYDKPLSSDTRSLSYDISAFVNGINHLQLRLLGGASVCFDCIEFRSDTPVRAMGMADSSVSLSMADYEIECEDGSCCQPILLRSLCKSPATLEVSVNGKRSSVAVGTGIRDLEISTEGIAPGKRVRVSVLKDGREIASGSFRRTSQPLRHTVDYVDQFMGSSGSRWMIGPGPWMPFGMVKIMPDNEDGHWKAGYEYGIENIAGFSHIHEWTMAGLLTMPACGPLKLIPGSELNPDEGYRSRIDKRTEKASIGYYCADLTDYDIRAEITATTRASLQRYTFNRPESPRVMVDFFFPMEYLWTVRGVAVRKVSASRIEGTVSSESGCYGYRGTQKYKLHFVMETDRPVKDVKAWRGNDLTAVQDSFTSDLEDCGLILEFDLGDGGPVLLRTGISLVSCENAALNLDREMSSPFGWDFEAVVENQRDCWQKIFDRVKVFTPDIEAKTKFYTNLYRALSPRTVWNDVNGQWMDPLGEVAQASPGREVYGGDSLWGTQWDLVPFYSILYPEYLSNWVYTLGETYRRGGWLPVGNPGMRYIRVMVGSPSIPFICSAWQHGIRDFDASLLSEAVIHQQFTSPVLWEDGTQLGNESYPDYLRLGYVPLYGDSWDWNSPHYQSYVSNTMEYAYQDWCAARFLSCVGRSTEAGILENRASNWKNLFDTESGFVRPRTSDGAFIPHFDPFHAPGFCEGSAWQYTWYVPHDVSSLISLMGEQRFIRNLEWGMEQSSKVNFNALGDNFSAYPINHGNQTTMHAAYLFDFTSESWRTQKWVRGIQEKYYGRGERDAYPGDEDQGQMSSWYVLSCLGLFEMDGGCGDDPLVCLGSPRFGRAEITLSDRYYGSSKLVISAPGASAERCLWDSASLNGRKLDSPMVRWADLREGGELFFDMK